MTSSTNQSSGICKRRKHFLVGEAVINWDQFSLLEIIGRLGVGATWDESMKGSCYPRVAVPSTSAATAPHGVMDVLVSKVKRCSTQLRHLSDVLLIHLLSGCDTINTDRVATGTVLFSQSDRTDYWYILLAGEVQLYINTSYNRKNYLLTTLSAGTVFGELDVVKHCCTAISSKPSEFIRIPQNHFISIYNKYADHLQPFIIIMQDTIADEQITSPCVAHNGHFSGATHLPYYPQGMENYGRPNGNDYREEQTTQQYHPEDRHDRYNLSSLTTTLPVISSSAVDVIQQSLQNQTNIFEFSSISIEERMKEAAAILRHCMVTQASHLIRERSIHKMNYPGCMIGTEMVDWLLELSVSLCAHPLSLSRFQVTGMWQTLLEQNIICHVTSEQQFMDKHLFYRWVADSCMNGKYSPSERLKDDPPTREDISNAVFYLSTVGPDALFRMILTKQSHDRTPEELDLVYEELLHVKALSHLSTMVKRELASVIGYTQHTHAGTVLFHQGDAGNHWYIILKGSVDISIHGKGVVCTLQEGDDFGKLALITDGPRAATVSLREDNSQFLLVNKYDFDRILREVESNTVRLKEHGQDVLVLEKMNWPRGAAVDQNTLPASSRGHCTYSVMAGLPEKMIEYILETRIDAHVEEGDMDLFLEDFIMTHIIHTSTTVLCNYLKNYYARKIPSQCSDTVSSVIDFEMESELCVQARRRVVSFVQLWVHTLGIHYFLDPVAKSFIEELYCLVLEDQLKYPGLNVVLHKMTLLRQLKEEAMLSIARHPAVVLECGILAAASPAPHPVLPSDYCNQIIHLSDTTSFTISIRMDKCAAEICEMAKNKLRYTQTNEQLCLVEVKSSGERIIFSPQDISIPTMVNLNSKLYVVYRDEVDSLVPQSDQYGPQHSIHSSVLEYLGSHEIAQQLCIIHQQLFEACDEIELIIQVVGRETFCGRVPSNLDLIMRRFNEVQYWCTTEILLATPAKRVNILRKFIKIAMYAKENSDLLALFAITLGLSNISISRLQLTWQRLPAKMRRQFAEFESLLDPSRNHRPYRALVAKMNPPLIPFIPLLLKDLTFIHEGNKTNFNGLVNFEKMHMIANILRSFRQCKSRFRGHSFDSRKIFDTQNLLRNFRVIDNQRYLMELSYQIEPKRRK